MDGQVTATLAALREQGAQTREPLRWAFVQALARRRAGCPPATRAALDQRLAAALAELAARLAVAPAAETLPVPPATPGPLAELSAALADGALPHAPAGELKALRYFRPTWSRLSVERQMDKALAQAPENAGPLNSHRLVLDTLQALRSSAPDYLNRFLAYADALLWLDRANATAASERSQQKAAESSLAKPGKKSAKPRQRKAPAKKAGGTAEA